MYFVDIFGAVVLAFFIVATRRKLSGPCAVQPCGEEFFVFESPRISIVYDRASTKDNRIYCIALFPARRCRYSSITGSRSTLQTVPSGCEWLLESPLLKHAKNEEPEY